MNEKNKRNLDYIFYTLIVIALFINIAMTIYSYPYLTFNCNSSVLKTSQSTDLDFVWTNDTLINTQETNFDTAFNMNNNSNIFTPDKYEFAFDKTDGTLFETTQEITYDTYTWNEIDDANDWINPLYVAGTKYNPVVFCYSNSGTQYGIEKENLDNFIPAGQNYNITFRVRWYSLTDIGSITQFKIVDPLTNILTNIRFTRISLEHIDIDYHTTVWNNLFELYDVNPNWFEFNFHFRHNTVFLRYWKNDVRNETNYSFPMKSATGGLDEMTLNVKLGGINFYIDNIGIYDKNVSIVNKEYAYVYETFGFNKYKFDQYSFYDFNNPFTENISQMYICENQRLRYDSTIRNVKPKTNFTGFINNIELNDVGGSGKQPSLIMITNDTINLNQIDFRIYGITLIQDTNEYSGNFESNNINVNQSYFFVLNNKLRYTLSVLDNSKLEYMSYNFDISDLESVNRSCSFDVKKTLPEYYQEFRVYYSDSTYSTWFAETSYASYNEILPQDKMIDSFYILATDNNISVFNKTFTGYISDITLFYYPNIDITITTTNFFGIIPVILFVVVVPILISRRTRLHFLFIPFVILMSIISMSTSLIPYWLGTIIIIFCIAYYLLKSRYGSE